MIRVLSKTGSLSDSVSEMGDKATAKSTMKAAGVPTIPGTEGLVEDLDEAKKIAKEIGYPVILKATAGGGGKGMRKVFSEDEMDDAMKKAQAEAGAAFA